MKTNTTSSKNGYSVLINTDPNDDDDDVEDNTYSVQQECINDETEINGQIIPQFDTTNAIFDKQYGSNVDNDATKIILNFISTIFGLNKLNLSSFIPQCLLLLIYQYIDNIPKITLFWPESVKIKAMMNQIWNRKYPEPVDLNHIEQIKDDDEALIATLLHPNTRILYASLMKVSSVDSSHERILGILTNKMLYLSNGQNYAMWQQFKNRSKIDDLMDGNTKINAKIAVQIANNLNIIYEEEIKATKIISRLIGMTKKHIFVNIIFSKTYIPTFLSLFGLPDVAENTDLFIWKWYIGVIRYIEDGRKRKRFEGNMKCKVIDLNGFSHITKLEYGDFLNTYLLQLNSNNSLENYLFEMNSNQQCKEWLAHLTEFGLEMEIIDMMQHQQTQIQSRCDCVLL